MQKPVVFKSDEYELYGVVHLPYKMSLEKPVPAVVFCHGFTGNKVEVHRIFVIMARRLERHGIASIRFDFRGCGDSTGDFLSTTIKGEIRDARHAVDFICSHAGIDKERVGILGFSLGGAIAAYAAGRDPRIKALALWAPAADLLEEEEQIRTEHEIRKVWKYKAVDYYGTLIGRDFIKEIPKIKPVNAIKKYNGPAIIIHGTDDHSVPLSHSASYYNVLKAKKLKVERHLIDGADHIFGSYKWEEKVINKTVKFFAGHL